MLVLLEDPRTSSEQVVCVDAAGFFLTRSEEEANLLVGRAATASSSSSRHGAGRERTRAELGPAQDARAADGSASETGTSTAQPIDMSNKTPPVSSPQAVYGRREGQHLKKLESRDGEKGGPAWRLLPSHVAAP